MEPIIDINWVSLALGLGMLAALAGIGVLVIKAAVAYAKKLWKSEG